MGYQFNITPDLIKNILNKKENDEVIDNLLNIISKSLNALLKICHNCPEQCIYNLDGKCKGFDLGPY